MRFITISSRATSDLATKDAPAPASPLEMLLGCHSHIRHFMQLGRTLADAEGVAPKEIAEAAKAVFRYFSHALPLHEADENKTLFSRLHAALPQGGLVREAAETMVEQHKAIDELAAELLSICASLGDRPQRLPSLACRLDQVTRALEDIFAAHLRLEETVVFPAISELLIPAQIEEMSREMHQRRQPPLGTIHLVH
jgi:iron-sulfur cluster repair protein YtfE (RIC family)